MKFAVSIAFALAASLASTASIAYAKGKKAAVATGQTILIFDASGSMMGYVGGRAKIEIARETTLKLIASRPAGLAMGLMAYGHRRSQDCTDIELLASPALENSSSLASAVRGLKARGQTPIYRSVMQAAELLRYKEQPGSIILVSDGEETCGGNLAELGAKLAKMGVDFKTHIICFAMTDAQTRDLRALAAATGGLCIEAGDADSLGEALRVATEAAAAKPTTLSLVPMDQDGSSLIKNGVSFSVFKKKGDERPVAEGRGGQWSTTLDAGDYFATAVFGTKTMEASIKVVAERNTQHTFVFAAPVLTLQAIMKEGGEPMEEGVTWRVTAPTKDKKSRFVTRSYDAIATIRLAPGSYTVTAERGTTRVSKDITFEDKPQTVTVVLGAGTLALTASTTKDGPSIESGNMKWTVHGAPDALGKRPYVTVSREHKPTLTLPAGNYLVTVQMGDARTKASFDVTPGETTQSHIVMGSGTLRATFKMHASAEPYSGTAGVKWTVYGEADELGKRKYVSVGRSSEYTFKLASGTYLLQLQVGSASVSQEVDVEPGKQTNAALNLNAGRLQLNATMSEGGQPIESDDHMKWTIYRATDDDQRGKYVVVVRKASTDTLLNAGRYFVTVERFSAKSSLVLDVRPGEPTKQTQNLNAGILRPKLTAEPSGRIKWSLYLAPKDDVKRKFITVQRKADALFLVNAGDYILKLEVGKKSSETPVTVVAGQTATPEISMPE